MANVFQQPEEHRYDDDDSDDGRVCKCKEKKAKPNKAKKPYLTVEEAAKLINVTDFTTFMAESSGKPLMRFVDYFESAFSHVSLAKFSWVELSRNNKMHIPMYNISSYAYSELKSWIGRQPTKALISFVEWCLERIFADLQRRQSQDLSSKSMVGIFVALGLVLRQRPYALVDLLPTLRETSIYQGQDMLNVVAWMIVQASTKDSAVGLYSWAHNLLPLWSKNGSTPQFREKILSMIDFGFYHQTNSKYLENGTLENGERLIPPSALEIIFRVTYSPSFSGIEDPVTARKFRQNFHYLVQVAVAGSKKLKKETRQIFSFAIKATGENNNMLYYEAVKLCALCLTHDAECYKIWDTFYLEKIKGSVGILEYISDNWEEYHEKLAPFDPLKETLRNFKQKNGETIASGKEVKLFEEADKYCKAILRKSSAYRCSQKMICFLFAFAITAELLTIIGIVFYALQE